MNVAHLVGHLRRDNRSEQDHLNYNYRLPDYAGKLGLEKTFDAFLRGQPGTRAVEVNNRGYRQAESTPVPSQPGSNVVLTLDFEIQKAAMEALENGLGEIGIKAGAAVVTEVHSGDVVAMVSRRIRPSTNLRRASVMCFGTNTLRTGLHPCYSEPHRNAIRPAPFSRLSLVWPHWKTA